MRLQYGIDSEQNLVYIDEVKRGKTELKCPYCGGLLTAKKGQKREHHFAHTEETCLYVSQERYFELPLFDKFHFSLSSTEYNALLLWHSGTPISRKMMLQLAQKEMFENRGYGYSITKLGKIAVGDLSMFLFSEIQNDLILEKLQKLENTVKVAWEQDKTDKNDLLFDLKIYRQRVKLILNQSLYLLRVTIDETEIYKIGVTTKALEELIFELEQKLKRFSDSVSIELLSSWEHWGSLKRYFVYKYQDFLCQHNEYKHKEYQLCTLLGNPNSYFTFSTLLLKKILRDLNRITDKYLNPVEQKILDGNNTEIEVAIDKQQQRSAAIKTGMQRAKHWGTHIGRSLTKESASQFLAKPKSKAVVAVLKKGLSLRQTAKEVGVSVNTVRKVKAALEQNNHH